MNKLKKIVLDHFELFVVLTLVLAVALTIFVVVNKIAFLNFFYIPTLIAGYILGKKKGVFVGIIAVLMVSLYAVLNPELFSGGPVELPFWNILLWGSFLIITAYVIGNLYEIKEEALTDLELAYRGILEILSKFIDSIDKYTHEHSVRVSELSAKVAIYMKLSHADIEDIRIAGLLHDIGKIEISLDVLKKASNLNKEEWELIKTHTTQAKHILRPVGGLLKSVIPLIETHHEHFDGGGYHNLKYEEIPLGSRILSVVDAYDSMITDRTYRTGRTPWEALQEIEKHSGTQFDPKVVNAFKGTIQKEVQFT